MLLKWSCIKEMEELIKNFNNLQTKVIWDDVIQKELRKNFKRPRKTNQTCNDCILGEFVDKHTEKIDFVHKIKFVQMKLGAVWQCIMGYVDGIEDLGIGHPSGLDLRSNELFPRGKFIMELKNSINTDNSSSRKHNISKLKQYITKNPDYTAIYGFVNDKKPEGRDETKDEGGFIVRYLSGKKLLKFVFGNDYDDVISAFRQKIKPFLEHK